MDDPRFNPSSPVPLYRQAADFIADQVEAGKLPPGTRLPSERDLAERWGIAYITVRRAMKELRDQGVVVSVPGKGTYVVPEAGRPA